MAISQSLRLLASSCGADLGQAPDDLGTKIQDNLSLLVRSTLGKSLMSRLGTTRLFTLVLFAALVPVTASHCATHTPRNIVVQWNIVVLEAIRNSRIGPSATGRALAVVHTCIYVAWAAYDAKAIGTELGGTLRRPEHERTVANKETAISYAAYRAAVELFPEAKRTLFDPFMAQLHYDPSNASTEQPLPLVSATRYVMPFAPSAATTAPISSAT